jgi:multiple antibiotic resistance protein
VAGTEATAMLDTAFSAFIAFFVAIDPIGLIPVFLALTPELGARLRRRVVARGVMIATFVLLSFALFGDAILRELGIGLPAFRIAGGIMLFLIALEMVFERRNRRRGDSADQAHLEYRVEELSVFPLGLPLIAGPAAITTVILQSSAAGGDPLRQVAVLLALLLTLLMVYLCLTAAASLERYLGPTLMGALSRLFGLLLAALSTQYVIDGIREAFHV